MTIEQLIEELRWVDNNSSEETRTMIAQCVKTYMREALRTVKDVVDETEMRATTRETLMAAIDFEMKG